MDDLANDFYNQKNENNEQAKILCSHVFFAMYFFFFATGFME